MFIYYNFYYTFIYYLKNIMDTEISEIFYASAISLC